MTYTWYWRKKIGPFELSFGKRGLKVKLKIWGH